MEAIEQEAYRGHTIRIFQDPEPQNPREDSNFGTMVCFHKKYVLGDETGLVSASFDGWSELEAYLVKEEDAAVMVSLYLYDHSGITIRTKPFDCPWDSGMVGIIYASRDDIRENFQVKRIHDETIDKARKLLESEVKTYNQYLTGEVYGFRIEDADGDDVDSCWGYNGEPSEIITECKLTIDRIINADKTNKHYPKVEVFVTKGMQFRAKIRESITEPTYEVTIGSNGWHDGKGRNHEKVIVIKMNTIIARLNGEFVAHSANVMIEELKEIANNNG